MALAEDPDFPSHYFEVNVDPDQCLAAQCGILEILPSIHPGFMEICTADFLQSLSLCPVTGLKCHMVPGFLDPS